MPALPKTFRAGQLDEETRMECGRVVRATAGSSKRQVDILE